MMAGVGRRIRQSIGRDPSGRWRKECRRFCSEWGYEERAVWYWWEQIAAAREMHSAIDMHRDVHEESAWLDCVSVFDARGRNPD